MSEPPPLPFSPPPLPDSEVPVTPLPRPRFARVGLIIALLLIGVSIAMAVLEGTLLKRSEKKEQQQPATAEVRVRASALSNLLARYLIGAREFMKLGHQWNEAAANQLSGSLADSGLNKPVDQFRNHIITAALQERPINTFELEALIESAPYLAEDLTFLNTLQQNQGQNIAQKDWDRFQRRHGWVARLARAHITGWPQPERTELLRDATITSLALISVVMVGFTALIGGTVFLVILFLRWRRGRLVAAMPPPAPGWSGTLLEGFAIYLFGYTFILPLLVEKFPAYRWLLLLSFAGGVVIIALLWPRWRGLPKKEWRLTLGLHRGRGFWREVGWGLAGWAVGLPLLAIGALISMYLSRVTGIVPSHPIVEEFAAPGMTRWYMALLAAVWAPLAEETMFRGLLFPALSARARWVIGALGSSFIFAIIHPQGWVGALPLIALAVTMCALRAFRGSLIAPMTLHALNNGLIATILLVAS